MSYQVHVINLKRRSDRWTTFQAEAAEKGLTNYIRMDAVDGTTMCLDQNLIHDLRNNNQIHQGNCGNFYSHMSLFVQLIYSNFDYFVILEDDVKLCQNFDSNLNLVIKNLPTNTDFDFNLIGYVVNTNETYYYNKNQSYTTGNFLDHPYWSGMFGYIINKKGARKMFQHYIENGILHPIDTLMLYQCRGGHIKVDMTIPTLVNAEVFAWNQTADTDIQNNRSLVTTQIKIQPKKLRIFALSFDLFISESGSGRSLNNLCQCLRRDFDVEIFCSCYIPTDKEMRIIFGTEMPNLIISQQWAVPQMWSYSKSKNLPFVQYVFGPNQFNQMFGSGERTYGNKLVISCLDVQAEVTRVANGVRNFFFNPIIDISNIDLIKNSLYKKYITIICSSDFYPIKGFDVFIKIAKIMPNHQFMAVGDHKIKMDVPPNVTMHPVVKKITDVLQYTKLLLAPSVIESFGMIIREAIIHGIPVICTDLPRPRIASFNRATFIPVEERTNETIWRDEILHILNFPSEIDTTELLAEYKAEVNANITKLISLFNQLI